MRILKKLFSTHLTGEKATTNTKRVKEASSDYFQTLKQEVAPLESVVVDFAVALKGTQLVSNRIELLQAIIQAFYDLKLKCVSLGPQYQVYFSEMWEHTQNSKCKDFCYIEHFEQELNTLLSNKDELLATEAVYISETENLQSKIEIILLSHSPILQTELYKFFNPIIRNEISSLLYTMEKNGDIKRTKHGRTYLLENQRITTHG